MSEGFKPESKPKVEVPLDSLPPDVVSTLAELQDRTAKLDIAPPLPIEEEIFASNLSVEQEEDLKNTLHNLQQK